MQRAGGMRSLLVFGTFCVAQGAASAEPATVEYELRRLALPTDRDRGFRVAGFAQLAGGSLSGGGADVPTVALAAGGELRYAGTRCAYGRVGGQARLAYHEGARTSFEQWASACIPIMIMEFGHHLEWDVRPSLLAPLGMRAGPNRRETVSFRWQPLRARFGHLLAAVQRGEAKKHGIELTDPIDPDDPGLPSGDAIVFDMRVDAVFAWSPGGEIVLRQTVEVVPLGYVKPQRGAWGADRDLAVDIGTGGGDFIEVGAAVRAWLVRVQNLSLGPVYATAGLGIASAGAGPFVDRYAREVEVTSPRAVIGVETGGSAIHGHVRAIRDVTLVPDGYVTVDSRVVAGVGLDRRSARVVLEGAIADTEVHVPGAMPVARATGGGALSVARRLTPHLDAIVQLDVARSFYATSATQLDFVPRWGATVFAAIQARAGRQ